MKVAKHGVWKSKDHNLRTWATPDSSDRFSKGEGQMLTPAKLQQVS